MNRSSLPISSLRGRMGLALLVAALIAVPLLHRPSTVAADSATAAGGSQTTPTGQGTTGNIATTATTTASDQTDLAVTVYNQDLALVRDVRQINLASGESILRFMDIAASINPATVHFRSLADPGKLKVLEQDYEYDLLDANRLLQKYVGRELTVRRLVWDKPNGASHWEVGPATLLANNNGQVWRIGDEIVTGDVGVDSFPALPGNLYERPTLLWQLENHGAARQTVEASYLTTNLSWSADYVLTVGREDSSADLDGWVTLINNSGAAFNNARLQLMAGDVHRAAPPPRAMTESVTVTGAAVGIAPFAQESFSEYHLYTLGRRTSIQDKETKQISLLSASSIPVEKEYVVNGQNYYFRSAQQPGAPIKDAVQVYYKFQNSEKSSLGMPLPAGTVRVYQADSHGGVLFVGEDNIDHTPKDESVRLHIGNAFDIVAERKQTDFQRISDRVYEMEYEITLRNHKDVPITVEVNEPIGGDWQMLSSTYKAEKTAAFAAQFEVPVEKDGTSVLRYRVRVHW